MEKMEGVIRNFRKEKKVKLWIRSKCSVFKLLSKEIFRDDAKQQPIVFLQSNFVSFAAILRLGRSCLWSDVLTWGFYAHAFIYYVFQDILKRYDGDEDGYNTINVSIANLAVVLRHLLPTLICDQFLD